MKRKNTETDFQSQMKAEGEIKAAKTRGRKVMAAAADEAKLDRAYRTKHKLEQVDDAVKRELAKVNGPVQDAWACPGFTYQP